MATAYTSLLGFALPVTGELSGTWGDTVNDSITKLVEDSIAGAATVSVTAGNVTLTTTGSGAANQARCAIIIATGTPGTARQIIAPSSSKAYIVINQSDSNVTFKGAATTGHVLKPGDANLLAWNGSDFIDIEQGDVAGPASATDNAVVRFDGTTGKLVQNSAVTIADTTGDIETSGKISVGDGTASLPSITNTGDTNTGIFFPDADTIAFAEGGAEAMRIDSSGNVGIGTSSPVARLTSSNSGALTLDSNDGDETGFALFCAPSTITANTVNSAIGFGSTAGRKYAAIGMQTYADADQTGLNFYVQPSATGSAATLTEAMRITSAGEVLVGGTTEIANSSGFLNIQTANQSPALYLFRNDLSISSEDVLGQIRFYGNDTTSNTPTQLAYIRATASGTHAAGDNPTDLVFGTTPDNSATVAEVLRITSEGFTRPKAYADTVVAIGNTGTSQTITCTSGNVFTATLTGNCTFTLSAPIATGSSSFTLILTNDATPSRTVAWSGGTFLFPGGAASLSRTTTANAVDVWVFFTPNGGTTWYGNIAMKNMTA